MNKNILILDFQLGNLFSVNQACENVGINAHISSDFHEIGKADGIILPGVGAFKEAMSNMKNLELINPLNDYVNSGKPLFGICLGLQLLFSESEEFGSGAGLNYIDGLVKSFSNSEKLEAGAKVPHIGWNRISESKSRDKTPLCEVKDNEYMYFVHSYFVEPANKEVILTETNYAGLTFCSSVYHKNIFATQFHPEKSGEKGISIYKNWAIQNNFI